jgi:hypothetical protein
MEKEQAIIQKWNTLVRRLLGDEQDNEPMTRLADDKRNCPSTKP